MKTIFYALVGMVVSLVCGTIIACGSLVALGGRLNSESLSSQPLSIPTLLVSCLDPLAIGLEIIAIALIVHKRKLIGGLHQRLAVTAAVLYGVWAALNLLGFLPLSLISTSSGSMQTALAGQWIKATAAILAYAVVPLLVYGLSSKVQRGLLLTGFSMSAVGGFGSIALAIGQLTLTPKSIGEQMVYIATFNVDYTRFPFPLLLVLSYLGGLLYLAVYIWKAWQIQNRISQEGSKLTLSALETRG
jgi:hypothetical protein